MKSVVVFIDDMDGDIYNSMQELYDAIVVAILNNAINIKIEIINESITLKITRRPPTRRGSDELSPVGLIDLLSGF